MRRIASILFTIALLQAYTGTAQTVTFSGKNIPLETVFSAIKKQTGYLVFWNPDAKKSAKPVSFKAASMPLADFLALVLKDQPLNYKIAERTIIVSKKNDEPPAADFKSTAPDPDTTKKLTLHGRILNEKSEPLAGASIHIKGASIGTATDAKGKFTIQAEVGQVLAVSYIGYDEKEITITPGKKDYTINLEQDMESLLNTVVVANTGYQKLKPNETNSSMVIIDRKTLNEQTSPNILDRLIGVTNGVLFNIGKTDARGRLNPISIGGTTTINASTAPLIVLDKFPFEGDINNINPSDISNVVILKDAAATAIYGARGANGVIVITTQKGRYNQKTRFQINSSVSFYELPDVYYLPKISSNDYIDVEEYLFNKAFDFGGRLYNIYSAITPALEVFVNRKEGLISAIDSANQIQLLKKNDSRQQFKKYFYSNSIIQQYSLNVRGGGESIAWLVSGSYNSSISSTEATSDKVNVRFSNTYKPIKKAEIAIDVYYTNSTSKSGKPDPHSLLLRNAPYLQFVDANGAPLSIPFDYRNSFIDILGGGSLLNWKYYPLDDYKHDVLRGRQEQTVADVEMKYLVLNDITINLSYQYQRQAKQSKRMADIESYYTRDRVNSFTNLNASSLTPPLKYPIPRGSILQISNNMLSSYAFRAQLDGKKKLRNHYISGIAGFEVRNVLGNDGYNATIYGYNDNPLTYGEINYQTQFPDIITGKLKTIPGRPSVSAKTTDRNVSIYANIAHVFKEKYSINISGRKDATNFFGLTANDKWNPLWAAGIGWELSRESFYHIKSLPNMRFRATWGYSGNVDLTKTPIVTLLYLNQINDAGISYASIANPANQSLRWEKVRQLNIGIDLSKEKGGFSGSIEFYQKRGLDLYGSTPYDYTAYGYAPEVTKNVANIKSTGFDIQINTKNIDGFIKWTSIFIINYNVSKTTKYFADVAANGIDIVGSSGSKITPVVGKPVYAIAAYRWGGLDAFGNPQGYLNGKLTTDYNSTLQLAKTQGIFATDTKYIGSATPTLFGSFTNYFFYKSLTISINILFKSGYYFKKPTLSYVNLFQNGIGHKDFENRWKKPGDEKLTTVPSFVFPAVSARDEFYQGAEIHVLPADNARINYVNLSYSLQKKVQINLNVANVGLIWKKSNLEIDPDYPNTIPPSRYITLGLNVEF